MAIYRATATIFRLINNNANRKIILPQTWISLTLTTRNLSNEKPKKDGPKLSYFFGQSDVPLIGKTIGQAFDEICAKYENKEAIVVVHQNIRKTFQQLQKDCDKLAAAFLSKGMKKGERIGIWSPNNYEWVITLLAAAKAGLILVNINPAYQAKELEYCLRKVGISTLVAAEQFKSQNYYNLLTSVVPEIKSSQPGNIKSERLPLLKNLIMISDKAHDGAFKFQEVFETADPQGWKLLQEMENMIDFDDACNIQFTSGTTGSPKGATLSHHNIVNNAIHIGRRVGYHLRDDHRICISVPLYHCFGTVIGVLNMVAYGAALVFPAPSFQADACLKAIHKEKCTSVYGTPTMFVDILNQPDFDKYNVKETVITGVMAGSICPETLVRETIERMGAKEFIILYGSTEISPGMLISRSDDSIKTKSTRVGNAIDHVEVKVVDKDNKIVPVGTPGEICSRGYNTMIGYWDDETKTKEAIKNGWYHTGDLAIMHEDGYGEIVGRIKDMIIRGGENVYPKEIEEFLLSNPKIMDVHVIGVPDSRMGEEICAWIKLKEGQTMTEDDVKSFCKGQIAHFKIPKFILFVTEFPVTVTGKVQKFVMREKMKEILKL